jgi:hypothetical protein
MPRKRTFAALALAATIGATAAVAHALDVSGRARFVYAVDPAARDHCPDIVAVRQEIVKRTGFDPFWEWAPRTIVVQILGDAKKGYTARVVRIQADGTSATRDLPSRDDCYEVASAAALAVSIALDSFRVSQPTDADSGVPAVDAAPPPAPNPPEPEPSQPLPSPAPLPSVVPSPPQLAAGADLSFVTGIAPAPSFAIAAFGEVRGRTAFVTAELEASAAKAVDRLQVATFAGTLAPCTRLGPAFLCALGKVGWVEAWSLGIAPGAANGAAFVALGGRGGAEVRLSALAFLRVHGDLLVEAYGPRFTVPQSTFQSGGMVFAPPRTFLEPSIIGGALGLALGTYFR